MAFITPTPTQPGSGTRPLPPSTGPLVIDETRCKGCELCAAACPKDCLALDRGRVNGLGYHPIALVEPDACTSCAFCARVCPDAVFTVWAPSHRPDAHRSEANR